MKSISNIASVGGSGGGTSSSILYYITNNSLYEDYYVRATGTFDSTLVYTTQLGTDGNAYQEVDGMEYYNLEFFYIDENEDEVILLNTTVSANAGCVIPIKLLGNKVFIYGNDHVETSYIMYSKSNGGEVTYTDGNLYIWRNGGGSTASYLVCGFIPFVKQSGMQTINFRYSCSYENSSYRTTYLGLGISNNDLLDYSLVSTVYQKSNAAMDNLSRIASGTSIIGLEDVATYYIKFYLQDPTAGYKQHLYIHDIWFE